MGKTSKTNREDLRTAIVTPRFKGELFAGYDQTGGTSIFDDAGRNYELVHMRDYKRLEARLKIAINALKKEAPGWDKCEHDYEPNTTMDYFRCDKCGARPQTVDALKALEADTKSNKNDK